MGTFINDTGFHKKTLVEIKAELEADFQTAFGDDIDLSEEGPFGQIIGILSKREADLWDGAEEIYTSRNPNQATGVSLDNICAETGVTRIDETPTTVEDVILYGDQGTVVPSGSQARQSTNDITYSSLAAVTIDQAAAREVQLEPESSPSGKTYTVTINGTPYTYVGGGGDTVGDVIDALVTLITAGSWAGVASNVNDQYLKLLDVDLNFNVTWTATFTLYLLGSGADFECDDNGANPLPANTLTVIVTPVTGWDSINNPIAGITGREVETDAELRIRRALTFLGGNATDEAIRSALLNEVNGVVSCTVRSNRNRDSNAQKIVFDANFISGNVIHVMVNGTAVTPISFTSDQQTTMNLLKTQIETDIAGSEVTVDPVDTNDRSIFIYISTIDIINVSVWVTGGAIQPDHAIYFCDQDGRPSNSFEAVVEGGNNTDIAEEIWDTMPSGIRPYGSVEVTIQDSQSEDQVIRFSRPTTKYIHVKVQRGYYPEEPYPSDGDNQIRQNIVNWALITYNPGVDVIRQRLNTPIYTVQGVGDLEVWIAVTDTSGGTPTWIQANIPISSREIANFDVSRIIVEDLP